MQPDFLTVGEGRRFCLYHPAQAAKARAALLYLHPFAEEMNKARRMAALQSRALAAAGCAVLQIDLLGCGDSSGDFADATWAAWRADALAGFSHLRALSGARPMLWGLRAGCLLAADIAAELPEAVDFIFWQPVVSGKTHWQQFMRLKMAGELGSGQASAIGEQLRRQLAAGQPVEIAGYDIAPALVSGLEQAELTPPIRDKSRDKGRVVWREVSLRDDAALAPASLKRIEAWRAAGYTVDARVVRGPAFWQTSEIEDAPELIASTLEALAEAP